MKNRHLKVLFLVVFSLFSCGRTPAWVDVRPGTYVYRTAKGENTYNIGSNSCFYATRIEKSYKTAEEQIQFEKSLENGNWILGNKDPNYLVLLKWEGCLFEEMSPFIVGGCDQNTMLLWSEDYPNTSISLDREETKNGSISVQISCVNSSDHSEAIYTFENVL